MDWVDWSVMVVRVVLVFFVLLIAVLLYIWMERKVIADMQTRVGPMRAGPRGMLVTLADGIKLFFKEGITPTNADRPVYLIAPILAMFPGFLAFCTIPFGEPVRAVRPRGAVPDHRPQHRHPVGARHDLDRRLRRGVGRLVQRFELSAARLRALERADDQLRGGHGSGPGRGDHVERPPVDVGDRRAAVGQLRAPLARRHPLRRAGVEHLPAVPRLRRVLHLRARRDEPSAVRPRRSRVRAGGRLPHRVLRDQVRDVLPGRVRQHGDDRGRRRHVVPGWLARAVVRRAAVVDRPAAVVPAEDHRGDLRDDPGARHAAAHALRPADAVRLEGADPVRPAVGHGRPGSWW